MHLVSKLKNDLNFFGFTMISEGEHEASASETTLINFMFTLCSNIVLCSLLLVFICS
jgi:hypothetical protein